MSLRYRDKNGAERIISGLTPGGDIEYGAVATRKGQTGALNLATGRNTYDIVFSENMPDGNYITELGVLSWPTGADTGGKITVLEGENSKRATGFTIYIYNATGATQTVNISWQAYKLYTVADAEALYSKVLDMEAMIPSSASSTNKFATADDLRTETRTLDRRLDDVEDVVPTSASITNKLATAADVEEAMENAGLQVCELVPSSPQDKDVMLYIGEETGFTKGGIYQYVADPGAWVLISTADVDLSKYETSWTGTKAEWDALPADEKKQYKIANITDDVIGGEVADVVQDGLMSPVTSNAVFDALSKLNFSVHTNWSINQGTSSPITVTVAGSWQILKSVTIEEPGWYFVHFATWYYFSESGVTPGYQKEFSNGIYVTGTNNNYFGAGETISSSNNAYSFAHSYGLIQIANTNGGTVGGRVYCGAVGHDIKAYGALHIIKLSSVV